MNGLTIYLVLLFLAYLFIRGASDLNDRIDRVEVWAKGSHINGKGRLRWLANALLAGAAAGHAHGAAHNYALR